ncbi:c-type cytochrome [Oleiharenicola sp. Vm1]|uniref:c-type cytochrome n=1 Tax=Oleiharenicola sp. Vm1 TaxID=3398393 RepID=UPI0039F5D9D4
MNTTSKIAVASLVLALAAGASYGAPASENWENSCASCHGADGKGQTKQGKKLKIRDYTDAKIQAELKDEEMVKAILDGVKGENGKERMKGFKEELSEADAKDLVAFIRKFKA